MRRLFGTDGIRGKVNKEPMTAEMAMQIGQAVGYVFKRKGHRQKIVVGKDTRLSGYMLESAIAAGISSMGGDVILVGSMPTPGIAFITSNMNADCGIVISASHNPFDDNGIKIFSRNGFKLSDNQEIEIEELIFSGKLPDLVSEACQIGRVFREEEDALRRYMLFLRNTFHKKMDLEGVKIVLDCANGATYKAAPAVFKQMRASIFPMNVNPDGKNINLECGSLYPECLAEEVVRRKADIGLAFDGDGDRLIAVDEKGNIVNGDKILAICAKHMKKEGILKNNIVVSTVMSNLGLSLALKEMGIIHSTSKVGDRYVLKEMIKNEVVLGGEESGHVIFLDCHTTGDGIITAFQVLAVMQEEKEPLSELAQIMKSFPQIVMNVDIKRKPDLKKVPKINQAIKDGEKELKDRGRVLVRYSGTQNVCRVMVEGQSQERIEKIAKRIADVVRAQLN